MGGYLGGAKKFFTKNLGLNFGMSAMLKQSQVFTSFIGVIFQLVGALVDVILAPLLPLFFPVIRMIGSWIPKVQAFMEGAANSIMTWMNTVIGWYDGFKTYISDKYDEWKEAWKKGPSEFASAIWQFVWGGITWAWGMIINTGLPWLWNQIKGLGDTIWNFLGSTAGRVFGWFTQAYIMFGGIRSLTNRFFKWALTWGAKLIGKLGGGILKLFGGIAKGIPKILGYVLKAAGFMIKMLFPGFGHIIVALSKAAGRLVKFLGGLVFRALKGIGGLIWKGAIGAVKWLFGSFRKFITESIKNLLGKLGSLLGKLPLIGGTMKKLGNLGKGLFKGVTGLASGVGKAVGGKGLLKAVGTAAKMSKAIPVLGSVATLGFGAVETYNNFKNHGWQAGLATAGKTIAATTLAATGNTVASMAVDIGGTMAINKFLKKKETEGNAGGPNMSPAAAAVGGNGATVVNQIVTGDGRTIQETEIYQQQQGDVIQSDLTKVLAANQQT